MKGDIRTIQRRVNTRDWDGVTEHRIGSVKSQFNTEVHTLETWLDNSPESVRVKEQLEDLIILLKTMRMMTNTTADSLFINQQIEDIERLINQNIR